jgi:hypothetical protein
MAGVALWSFGTLIAPPAAQMGIYALCATRALVSGWLPLVLRQNSFSLLSACQHRQCCC